MEEIVKLGNLGDHLLTVAFDNASQFSIGMLYSISLLSIMLIGWNIARGNLAVLSHVVGFLLIACFWIGVVDNIKDISLHIQEGAIQLGLMVGGGLGDSDNPANFLMSPLEIFRQGYAISDALWDKSDQSCYISWLGCFGMFPTWFPVWATAGAVLFVFMFSSLGLLGLALLYKFGIIAGICMVPLAIFPPTASLGTSPIRFVFHSFAHFLVQTMIISLGLALFRDIALEPDMVGWSLVLPYIIASTVWIALMLGGIWITHSLVSGGLQRAGSLFGAPLGMAMMAGRAAAVRMTGSASAVVSQTVSTISSAANAPKASAINRGAS